MQRELVLVLDNIRSIYNVGSIFRSADGAGVKKVYLTGITPYPKMVNDARKPWEIETVSQKLHKTALGAEEFVDWEYANTAEDIVKHLESEKYKIIGLEQTMDAQNVFQYHTADKVALIVGNEIEGVSPALLDLCDGKVVIPMVGRKESLNVSVATAIAVFLLLHN